MNISSDAVKHSRFLFHNFGYGTYTSNHRRISYILLVWLYLVNVQFCCIMVVGYVLIA